MREVEGERKSWRTESVCMSAMLPSLRFGLGKTCVDLEDVYGKIWAGKSWIGRICVDLEEQRQQHPQNHPSGVRSLKNGKERLMSEKDIFNTQLQCLNGK